MQSFQENLGLVVLMPGSGSIAAAIVVVGLLIVRHRDKSAWAPSTAFQIVTSVIFVAWSAGSAVMWFIGGWTLWARVAATVAVAIAALSITFVRRPPQSWRTLGTAAPLRRRSWRSFASRASLIEWTAITAALTLVVAVSAASAGSQPYAIVTLGAGSILLTFGWPVGLAILGGVGLLTAAAVSALRNVAAPPFSNDTAQESRERAVASTRIVTVATTVCTLVLASVLQLMGQATGGPLPPGIAEFYDGAGQFPTALSLVLLGWVLEVSALIRLLCIGYFRPRRSGVGQRATSADASEQS